MAKKRYQPPTQGAGGQIFDSIFLLVLVYVALLLPLVFGIAAPGTVPIKQTGTPTWESLHQNPTMAQQWQKLGYTPEKAAPIINQRFNYTIDPVGLIITIVVIVGYFFFVLKWSKKEYLEVIAEKFGDDEG